MSKVIKLSEMINPVFKSLWECGKPYTIAQGGRGSFKSSTISLKLVCMMLKQAQAGNKGNVVCIRENATNLRDSVFEQIQWALEKLGVYDEFRIGTSPLKIEHKRSGSRFYFYGADNPHKLKSNTVGNIIAVWYEECANMKGVDVFDQANPTFIRQKPDNVDMVRVFYSYNPPKNPYDWINEWVESKQGDPDYLVHKSSYLDDKLGHTTQQQLDLIRSYKANDYNYYRWLYLGEVVGLGTNVYNMDSVRQINSVDELVGVNNPLVELFFSADTGHSISATTVGCYGVTYQGDVIVLDTMYYSPEGQLHKKPPSELAGMMYEFVKRLTDRYQLPIRNMTLDSAESALSNQYYADYGVSWHKVAKLSKADMIDRVQNVIAQGRLYYLPTDDNLEYFLKQHQRYQWDAKTLKFGRPEVVKVDDHTCDALQYFVLDNQDILVGG